MTKQKIIIWRFARKPKNAAAEAGRDLALVFTGENRTEHGTLSETVGDLETVKQNGGRIKEVDGKIYVAFDHFDEFEQDMKDPLLGMV